MFPSTTSLLALPQSCVFCGLGDTKFFDRFDWNLDLLSRLGIKARAWLPLLLHKFAKTGQDKFAVPFNLFVGERAQRIEKYSSGFFVGLGGFGQCALKVLFWSFEKNWEVVYRTTSPSLQHKQNVDFG